MTLERGESSVPGCEDMLPAGDGDRGGEEGIALLIEVEVWMKSKKYNLLPSGYHDIW